MAFKLEKFDAVTAPLKGDLPQGEDVRYDPLFFELQSEVENIASGNADWEKIEEQCLELLTEKAKDLRVLAYLSAALTKRYGFAGLADAVEVTKLFVEKHWKGVHPKRDRQRGSALEWILIRVPDYVEEIKPKEEDREALAQLVDDIRWLDPELRKKLGPDAPSFMPLIGPLEKHRQRLGPDPAEVEQQEAEKAEKAKEAEKESAEKAEKETVDEKRKGAAAAATPKAEEPKAEETEAETKAAEAPSQQPTGRPASRAPARRPQVEVDLPKQEPVADNATVAEIKNRVRSLVPFLRKADPGSPLSYRISRLIKWAELAGPPPRDAKKGGDATMVPVPRQQQRDALENLLTNKQWPQLLEASESAFQADSGTFWLDLQRFTVLALEGLACADAAEVVISELRELLGRFPALIRLTFAGGEIPFAGPETRRWIEESVRKMDVAMLQLGGAGAAASMLDEDDTREVQSLLAKKNLAGALTVLQDAIAKSPDVGSRFHTRLAAARLCLEANRLAWARNLLEDLAKEANAFDFETWEPETAVQLFHLQALCYGKLSRAAEGEEAERLEEDLAEAQARLFRLDLRPIALIEDALGEDAPKGSWWRLRR